MSKSSKFYAKEVKDRKITFRVRERILTSHNIKYNFSCLQDIQLIMPTVLILLFTILIMVTVGLQVNIDRLNVLQ